VPKPVPVISNCVDDCHVTDWMAGWALWAVVGEDRAKTTDTTVAKRTIFLVIFLSISTCFGARHSTSEPAAYKPPPGAVATIVGDWFE
jgi:hypothetical protein